MNPTLSTFTLASRKRQKVSQGFIVIEQWKGPASGFDAFVATYSFGAAHGTYTTSFLNSIEELPLGGTGLSSGVTVVQLTYAPENYQTSGLVSGLSPAKRRLKSTPI